jgi:selenocysteine lyase/cysteine desulfurase
LDRRSFFAAAAAAGGFASLASNGLAAQMGAKSGGANDAAYWKKIRADFPLGPNEIFLNTGTLGCTPNVVIKTMTETLQRIALLPPINAGEENRVNVPKVREKIAKLFNASPVECTVTTATTAGINIALLGLDWKPGDEILLSSHEHGGGINPSKYVAKRFGAKVVTWDLPTNPKSESEILDNLQAKITNRTRMIVLSHVMYTTGFVAPVDAIGAIAKQKNILYMVDAAHPAGLMPIDVKRMNASFYSCAGHKWMCGPAGTGLLYVNASVLPTMHPISVGQVNDKPIAEADHLHDWSNVPVAQILGLGAAIDYHNAMGSQRVFDHDMALINRFKRGLSSVSNVDLVSSYEGKNAGPVVTVELKGNKECADVVKRMKAEHNVTIRTMVHKELPRLSNTIRVSAHVYNNEEDIDKCLAALKAVVA